MLMPEIAVIADDLTGAADTGVQFARAGYSTAVVFRGEPVPAEDLDAVVFDTDSRTRRPASPPGTSSRPGAPPAPPASSTRSSTRPCAARSPPSSPPPSRPPAAVAPSSPQPSRPQDGPPAGGIQLVHGVPVHETEMRNDPRTPVREGHVPTPSRLVVFLRRHPRASRTSHDPENVRRALEESECDRRRRGARRGPGGAGAGRARPVVRTLGRLGGAGAGARQRLPGTARKEGVILCPRRPVRCSSSIGCLNGASREQLAKTGRGGTGRWPYPSAPGSTARSRRWRGSAGGRSPAGRALVFTRPGRASQQTRGRGACGSLAGRGRRRALEARSFRRAGADRGFYGGQGLAGARRLGHPARGERWRPACRWGTLIGPTPTRSSPRQGASADRTRW